VIEAETAIRAAGGVAARLCARAEWESSPQGGAVAAEPWIRFRPGDREHRPRLERLRVLDFTRVLAGPTTTKFLASLGAEVLRIDPPRMPELLDQHIDTGAGKRSATADLTDAATLKLVRQLAASADIVMLGYRPGALARFGLDPDELHAARPDLAIVHLDAWATAAHGAANEASTRSFRRQPGSAISTATPTARRARYRSRRWTTQAAMAAAAALALLERGGIAHLSLARTADELFALPAPNGSSLQLDVPLTEIDSPYGRLRQVRPIIAEPRAPSEYGAAPLAWS
jgi:CoA-transferase family III